MMGGDTSGVLARNVQMGTPNNTVLGVLLLVLDRSASSLGWRCFKKLLICNTL